MPAVLSAHSSFIGSRMFACLCVTCHLHFWQNDQGFLHATAVVTGGGVDTKRESEQEVNSAEENFSAASARI